MDRVSLKTLSNYNGTTGKKKKHNQKVEKKHNQKGKATTMASWILGFGIGYFNCPWFSKKTINGQHKLKRYFLFLINRKGSLDEFSAPKKNKIRK